VLAEVGHSGQNSKQNCHFGFEELMRYLDVLLTAVAMLLMNGTANAELLGTVPKIYDGDTFALCDKNICNRIRICGINAPELGESGAAQATAALRSIVDGKTVRCIQVGDGTLCDGRSRPTNQGRVVAQCFVGSVDIARVLVKGGFACDWERFSGGAYLGTPCP
jgi:endonuclease YncB( thermonuclease family)